MKVFFPGLFVFSVFFTLELTASADVTVPSANSTENSSALNSTSVGNSISQPSGDARGSSASPTHTSHPLGVIRPRSGGTLSVDGLLKKLELKSADLRTKLKQLVDQLSTEWNRDMMLQLIISADQSLSELKQLNHKDLPDAIRKQVEKLEQSVENIKTTVTLLIKGRDMEHQNFTGKIGNNSYSLLKLRSWVEDLSYQVSSFEETHDLLRENLAKVSEDIAFEMKQVFVFVDRIGWEYITLDLRTELHNLNASVNVFVNKLRVINENKHIITRLDLQIRSLNTELNNYYEHPDAHGNSLKLLQVMKQKLAGIMAKIKRLHVPGTLIHAAERLKRRILDAESFFFNILNKIPSGKNSNNPNVMPNITVSIDKTAEYQTLLLRLEEALDDIGRKISFQSNISSLMQIKVNIENILAKIQETHNHDVSEEVKLKLTLAYQRAVKYEKLVWSIIAYYESPQTAGVNNSEFENTKTAFEKVLIVLHKQYEHLQTLLNFKHNLNVLLIIKYQTEKIISHLEYLEKSGKIVPLQQRQFEDFLKEIKYFLLQISSVVDQKIRFDFTHQQQVIVDLNHRLRDTGNQLNYPLNITRLQEIYGNILIILSDLVKLEESHVSPDHLIEIRRLKELGIEYILLILLSTQGQTDSLKTYLINDNNDLRDRIRHLEIYYEQLLKQINSLPKSFYDTKYVYTLLLTLRHLQQAKRPQPPREEKVKPADSNTDPLDPPFPDVTPPNGILIRPYPPCTNVIPGDGNTSPLYPPCLTVKPPDDNTDPLDPSFPDVTPPNGIIIPSYPPCTNGIPGDGNTSPLYPPCLTVKPPYDNTDPLDPPFPVVTPPDGITIPPYPPCTSVTPPDSTTVHLYPPCPNVTPPDGNTDPLYPPCLIQGEICSRNFTVTGYDKQTPIENLLVIVARVKSIRSHFIRLVREASVQVGASYYEMYIVQLVRMLRDLKYIKIFSTIPEDLRRKIEDLEMDLWRFKIHVELTSGTKREDPLPGEDPNNEGSGPSTTPCVKDSGDADFLRIFGSIENELRIIFSWLSQETRLSNINLMNVHIHRIIWKIKTIGRNVPGNLQSQITILEEIIKRLLYEVQLRTKQIRERRMIIPSLFDPIPIPQANSSSIGEIYEKIYQFEILLGELEKHSKYNPLDQPTLRNFFNQFENQVLELQNLETRPGQHTFLIVRLLTRNIRCVQDKIAKEMRHTREVEPARFTPPSQSLTVESRIDQLYKNLMYLSREMSYKLHHLSVQQMNSELHRILLDLRNLQTHGLPKKLEDEIAYLIEMEKTLDKRLGQALAGNSQVVVYSSQTVNSPNYDFKDVLVELAGNLRIIKRRFSSAEEKSGLFDIFSKVASILDDLLLLKKENPSLNFRKSVDVQQQIALNFLKTIEDQIQAKIFIPITREIDFLLSRLGNKLSAEPVEGPREELMEVKRELAYVSDFIHASTNTKGILQMRNHILSIVNRLIDITKVNLSEIYHETLARLSRVTESYL